MSALVNDVTGPVGVAHGDRLLGLDAVRGFALLGITLVNMQYFAGSGAEAMNPAPPTGAGTTDVAAHYFVSAFCEAKFFPLYSMLFGIGLVMMMERVVKTGGRWVPMMLRRLGALAIFGLVHAVLVWNGDILFIYACVGLGSLLFVRAGVRVLVGVGLGALVVGMVGIAGWAALNASQGMMFGAVPKPIGTPLPAALADLPPLARYWEGFTYRDGVYSNAAWHSAEIEGYGKGPFLQALGLRVSGWVFMLLVMTVSYGWIVLAMFAFGMATVKSGLLAPASSWRRSRVAVVCFALGVPLGVGGAVISGGASGPMGGAAGSIMTTLAGPMLAMGWLAVFMNAGQKVGGMSAGGTAGWLGRVLDALARVGRMALTNYLLTSVLATFLMYHWGLGLIGRFGPAAQVGVSVAIYAVIVIFAAVWTRRVGQGPMERLWRGARPRG